MRYHKVSRDANHVEIVKDLRKLGYAVVDLAAVGNGVPDIIVADAVITALIEIKMSTGRGIFISQIEFLAKWPGVTGFAETTEDVTALMRDPDKHKLTLREKDVLLQFCRDYRASSISDRPMVRMKEFEKVFIEMRTGKAPC